MFFYQQKHGAKNIFFSVSLIVTSIFTALDYIRVPIHFGATEVIQDR